MLWLWLIQEFLYGTGEMVSTAGVIGKVLSYMSRTPTGKPAGPLAPATLEGRISFQDVTFTYPSSPDKPVLKVSVCCLRTRLLHIENQVKSNLYIL